MKKLISLLLFLVLSLSLAATAGASEAVALPELQGNWYLNQISHANGVESHGMFGVWHFTQFNNDGSGYIHEQNFLNSYPVSSAKITWKVLSETEAELVFNGETLVMTYDGQFLSFTMADGSTWQFAQLGSEVGKEISNEMSNLCFTEKSGAEYAEIEGIFKAAAVFYNTGNGIQFIKFGENTIPSDTLIHVEDNYKGEQRYAIRLIRNREMGFTDVNSFEQATEAIMMADVIYENSDVKALDDKSFENVTLYGTDGNQMQLTAFYNQKWKESCLLHVDGVYYICMPIY